MESHIKSHLQWKQLTSFYFFSTLSIEVMENILLELYTIKNWVTKRENDYFLDYYDERKRERLDEKDTKNFCMGDAVCAVAKRSGNAANKTQKSSCCNKQML